MAAFSSSASSTTAYSVYAFDFGVDTHDGWPDEKRRAEIERGREEVIRRFKEDRASLRAHLERALYGDNAELQAQLEAVAEPQLTDSIYKPLIDRIDPERLIEKLELAFEVYNQSEIRRIQREMDDDDDFMLLAGQ